MSLLRVIQRQRTDSEYLFHREPYSGGASNVRSLSPKLAVSPSRGRRLEAAPFPRLTGGTAPTGRRCRKRTPFGFSKCLISNSTNLFFTLFSCKVY